MIQKRSYLLLEVLIAMALVALAAIPLLAPGIWMIKNEKMFQQQIEIDRQASLLFAKIVENYYQGGEGVVQPPKGFTYQIKDSKEKGERYYLYLYEIVHGKQTFTYELFVERRKSDS